MLMWRYLADHDFGSSARPAIGQGPEAPSPQTAGLGAARDRTRARVPPGLDHLYECLITLAITWCFT